MLVICPAGESPARGDCPVATVVILGGGEGDQSVGSPRVKVSVGTAIGRVRSAREASKSAGRSASELMEPRNGVPTRSGFVGESGVPNPSDKGQGQRRRPARNWVDSRWTSRGLRRRHVDKDKGRKHGTSGGSPIRHSRRAKALRISLQSEVAVCLPEGRMGSGKR